MDNIVGHALAAAAGWLAGMLVNYLADVLPSRKSLAAPFCLHCGAAPGWRQYFIFPYRCAKCGMRRVSRTWVVEFTGVGLALGMYSFPAVRLEFWAAMLLLAYLGTVTVIDFEHHLILHPVSLAGAVIGVWLGVSLHGWQATLLGGAAGFGAMLGLYLFGFWLMGLIARRRGQTLAEEPLGFGDVNFAGVMGLLLGWPGVIAGIMLTILLAGAGAILFIIIRVLQKKYQAEMYIAYGPYMVLTIFILLFIR